MLDTGYYYVCTIAVLIQSYFICDMYIELKRTKEVLEKIETSFREDHVRLLSRISSHLCSIAGNKKYAAKEEHVSI